jgi:hypothetical protein
MNVTSMTPLPVARPPRPDGVDQRTTLTVLAARNGLQQANQKLVDTVVQNARAMEGNPTTFDVYA